MHRFRILRLLSLVIDYLFVITVFGLIMYSLLGTKNMGYIFLVIFPWYCYCVITAVMFKGATLGQVICGIKVVTLKDEELNAFSIMWLQLIRILYVTPFLFVPMIIQEFVSLFLPTFRNLESYATKTKFVIKIIEREEKVICK